MRVKSHAVRHQPVTIDGHWHRGPSCQHQHSGSQQLLGFLIPVPGLYWHQHFLPFNVRCRTIRSSGIKNCTKEEKETPCTSKQLAVLRHTPSTFTLLAKERDTPCIPTHTAGDGYTCTSTGLAVERLHHASPYYWCSSDSKRYICKFILLGVERDTSGKPTLLVVQRDTSCCSCMSTLLVLQRYIMHIHTAYCILLRCTVHVREQCCTLLRWIAPFWATLHP